MEMDEKAKTRPEQTSDAAVDVRRAVGLRRRAADRGPRESCRDKYELFIDGEFRAPRSRKYFDTINPATTEPLAKIAQAGNSDVDAAVAAARHAQQEHVWGPMSGGDRARYIFRIARLIQERSRELACLETMDGGKPIRESRDVDVPLAAQWFFYHAGWADKLHLAFPGSKVEPKGVIGQVIPWNFPLLMAAWKLAPALACGNTVVLKPAETTPAHRVASRAKSSQQAELLPPGVVSIVTGDGKNRRRARAPSRCGQGRVHR